MLRETNTILGTAKKEGMIANIAEDSIIESGNMVTIKGKKLVNFGSCSYLGLELDSRIKEGIKDMVNRYGSMLSSSPAYLKLDAYQEAESLLSKIFDHEVLLSSTCTLGHLANLPILLNQNDLVLLDQQVHNSVTEAVNLASIKGFEIIRIKHNRIDLLKQLIEKNKDKYNKIWYLADGIYSMYGDAAPVLEIRELLDKYSNFYFYVDDAHGMGWAGKKGKGYVLSKMDYHERMILVSSLAKGVAAAGGVTIVPDPELNDLIRNCGSTHIFAGPIPPAMLGALNASLKILLSEELPVLQNSLHFKMNFFKQKAKEYQLPLITSNEPSPIFYLGIGDQQITFQMFEALKNAGYYTNVAIYPAVSEKKSGLRIPITNHHSIEQLEGVLSVIAEKLYTLLKKTDHDIEKIKSLYGLERSLAF